MQPMTIGNRLTLVELDRQGWEATVRGHAAFRENVFMAPGYYASWQEHECARPTCLRIDAAENVYLYPFFVRDVVLEEADLRCRSMFSAYGYGGLVSSSSKPSSLELQAVNRAVDDWCHGNGIASEFLRQDHTLQQSYCLRDMSYHVARYELGRTLTADARTTRLPDHAQRPIRKARSHGLRCDTSLLCSGWSDFQRLYASSMERLNASPFYRLNAAFFEQLAREIGDRAEVLFITDRQGEPIAAALTLACGRNQVLFLTGSSNVATTLAANDLLYCGVIERAATVGYASLLLGGGRSADAADSLYRFKSKYANYCVRSLIGTKVHDPRAHHAITTEWRRLNPHRLETYGHFFQCYNF